MGDFFLGGGGGEGVCAHRKPFFPFSCFVVEYNDPRGCDLRQQLPQWPNITLIFMFILFIHFLFILFLLLYLYIFNNTPPDPP